MSFDNTPPGDPEALADRLISIGRDPVRLFAMREAASRPVADRTLTGYADFVEVAYGDLASDRGETPSLVAVMGDDFAGVDLPALKAAARMGAWTQANGCRPRACEAPAVAPRSTRWSASTDVRRGSRWRVSSPPFRRSQSGGAASRRFCRAPPPACGWGAPWRPRPRRPPATPAEITRKRVVMEGALLRLEAQVFAQARATQGAATFGALEQRVAAIEAGLKTRLAEDAARLSR